jgi:hypothetical protein
MDDEVGQPRELWMFAASPPRDLQQLHTFTTFHSRVRILELIPNPVFEISMPDFIGR